MGIEVRAVPQWNFDGGLLDQNHLVADDLDPASLPRPIAKSPGGTRLAKDLPALVVIADEKIQPEFAAPLRVGDQGDVQRQVPIREAYRIDVASLKRSVWL
jgi:hypothetical protein